MQAPHGDIFAAGRELVFIHQRSFSGLFWQKDRGSGDLNHTHQAGLPALSCQAPCLRGPGCVSSGKGGPSVTHIKHLVGGNKGLTQSRANGEEE